MAQKGVPLQDFIKKLPLKMRIYMFWYGIKLRFRYWWER